MSFSKMTPYELGESKSVDAISYLLKYLDNGSANEKRLAASAIYKLSEFYLEQCLVTKSALLNNLQLDMPQVRQYTLKALSKFDFEENEMKVIKGCYKKEDKSYNLDLFNQIFNKNTTVIINTITANSSRLEKSEANNTPIINSLNNITINDVNIDCQMSDYELIKYHILKTVDFNRRIGYKLKSSNLISILKGNKLNVDQENKDKFGTYEALSRYNRKVICDVMLSLVGFELSSEVLVKDGFVLEFEMLTDLGVEKLNKACVTYKDLDDIFEKLTKRQTEEISQYDNFSQIVEQQNVNQYHPIKKSVSFTVNTNDLHEFSYADFTKNRISKYDSLDMLEVTGKLNDMIMSASEMSGKNSIRNFEMLSMRLNGYDRKLMTLQEIGDKFGVTRERIRQCVNKAKSTLLNRLIRTLEFKNIYNELQISIFGESSVITATEWIYLFDMFHKYYSIDKSLEIMNMITNTRNFREISMWIKGIYIFEKSMYYKSVRLQIKKEEKINRFDNWLIDNTIFPAKMNKNAEEIFESLKIKRHVNHENNNSGKFFCPKMNMDIEYESGLELSLLLSLSESKYVKAYKVQSFIIKYVYGNHSSYYFPDIQILTHDNKFIIFECKPFINMVSYINMEKYKALAKYCESMGFGYIYSGKKGIK